MSGWFPSTPGEVMLAREKVGFATPVPPSVPGTLWFSFAQRGTWEFVVHPVDALHYMEHGITIDGLHMRVEKIEEWPLMGAWHMKCIDPEANKDFTPDVRPSGNHDKP